MVGIHQFSINKTFLESNQVMPLSSHNRPQAVDNRNVELVAQADWLIQLSVQMIHELQDLLSYQLLHV